MLVKLIIPITVVNLVTGYTKCSIKNTTFKYYGRKNTTTMENEIKTFQGISKYKCLIQCRKHPLCMAFSYASSSALCNIYEHDSKSANVSLIHSAGVWFYDVHNNTDFIEGNVDSCVQGHRCFNGGSCRSDSSSSGYFCTCTDNYHGQFCQDTNGPPILKCPSNQIITADSDCMATATWKPPNVTDNSGYSSTAVCDYVSGSTFSNYSTIVTCNATDDFDNTGYCKFTVKIYDDTAPNVTCPSDIELCADLGTYSVNATWEAASASDNCCSKVDITTNYTSGEPLSLGVYIVGYTATDCFENTGSCKFTVEVKDCEAPALKCPPNINVIVTGDDYCMATTFWTTPTVTDNSGYSFTPICDYLNGSTFSKLNTTVTCNATDDYDNTGYCTFNIFIIDETPPNVTCPSDIEVCTDLGTYSVNATWEAASVSENCCSKVDISTNYTSGEPLSIGLYTVGYTATDCFENTGSCKFTVAVKDCEAPVLKCPRDINVKLIATFWTSPTVSDNSGYSFRPTCDYLNGSTFSEIKTIVTCKATDDYDNTGYCTFNISSVDYPRDCREILENTDVASSGEYMVHPNAEGEPFRVYCDMDTDGGGWTVFQRREDGSINFTRNWSEYKQGFGNVCGEHWLGNDKIHQLTSSGTYKLLVTLSTWDGEQASATYNYFKIENEASQYKLSLREYTAGDTNYPGDSLEEHNEMKFSTIDEDNDRKGGSSCAKEYLGGWWYHNCHCANLNGHYFSGRINDISDRGTGVSWYTWKGHGYSMKTTEMKIYRKNTI